MNNGNGRARIARMRASRVANTGAAYGLLGLGRSRRNNNGANNGVNNAASVLLGFAAPRRNRKGRNPQRANAAAVNANYSSANALRALANAPNAPTNRAFAGQLQAAVSSGNTGAVQEMLANTSPRRLSSAGYLLVLAALATAGAYSVLSTLRRVRGNVPAGYNNASRNQGTILGFTRR